MNALRLVARRQVRTLMRAAGVRSCAPTFTTSPSMQLRTAKKAAPKKVAKKVTKKAVAKKPAKKVTQKTLATKRASALKKAAAAQKKAARKAAQKAARKAAADKKRARISARILSRKQRAAAQRSRQLAAKNQRIAAKKAALEKKRSTRKAIRASGAVNPTALFVQKVGTGKGRVDIKALAAQWKALSEDQKQQYRVQAKKNLATRNATRLRLKANSAVKNKYALFIKNNFAAAYEAAKKTNSTPRGTFRAASAAVAKKYKSQ
eukprot:TRINITY_DN260_c0_g1_i1.p1 TRINITY_DN260_c0_g1~~TRINITY_DN260_c0_g1_i1.p1  ORF type:complete len:263 (+),score=71.90 TRINITY_DN260_c0_g1_i1:54-842(+)